jgi:AcrR family transcriptional regulator
MFPPMKGANHGYANARERAVRAGIAALLQPPVWAPEALDLGAFAQLLRDGRGPAARVGVSEAVDAAILDGIRWVLHDRLRGGRPEQLRALGDPIAEWVLGYEGPDASVPGPSDEAARSASMRSLAPMLDLFGAAGDEQARPRERIMRAVVELSAQRGYAAMATSAIFERAGVSRETFHENFSSRQEAAIAAYDLASLRALGATLGSFQAASDWPAAIHASLWTLLELIAAAPELARLAFVEIGASGASGRERALERLDSFAALLDPGFALTAEPPPRVVGDMIAAGVWGVIEAQAMRGASHELRALTSPLTYFALSPFVGPGEAARIASGPPQRPAPRR